MIKKLAKLKYWEIAALGLSLAVVANLLVMFAVRFINGTWPQTNEAAHIAYIVLSAFLSWTIVGIFVEAINQKHREALVEDALDTISDLYASFKMEPAPEHNGSHVDSPYVDIEPGTGKHRQKESDHA
jgi:hypothetical protein